MKKAILYVVIFIFVLAVVYIALGYSPWFAIKLSAPPMEYFVASIKKMWYIKMPIAVAVSSAVLTLICKLKN